MQNGPWTASMVPWIPARKGGIDGGISGWLAASPAQLNLGNMYDTGRGVPQDYAEALRWYWLAAE